MKCKYCAEYIRRAQKIENFEVACRALELDPKRESDWPAIVKAMGSIGQFGTIRLARGYPNEKYKALADEKTFATVADVGLHFYWMMLDVWDEVSVSYYKERAEDKASREADFNGFVEKRYTAYKKRDDEIFEKMKFKAQ